ncbi:MAG: carbon starvation protein A [Desulfonauticus sp.]|nr:carbon starvation protein A [Desulfonauticus sp.]
MSSVIVLAAIVIYVIFYFTYGKFLDKRVVGAREDVQVPSEKLYDGVDYVPAHRFVLFGHHFASIAGAGPIVGPVLAMGYGWLPGILWIWFGNVFIGAVHDYGALCASVRYDGKSVQYVAADLLGKFTGRTFAWFILLLLILVVAAFAAVIGGIYVKHPDAAAAYVYKIIFAIILGFLLYRTKLPFSISTLIGIVFLLVSIYLGPKTPLKLSYNSWMIIFFFYIIIAASIPVNILLQPRDYMNSFLLYFGLIAGGIAALFSLKGFSVPAFASFNPPIIGGKPTPFWPAIPLIIACGALSGFHSLVASGTSSKQISSEKDALFIGYGAMFTEGFLSTIVIVSIAAFGITALQKVDPGASISNWAIDYYKILLKKLGGGANIFVSSYAEMTVSVLHLPKTFMITLAAMWVSSFAMTTLDTTNRLARYTISELAEPLREKYPSVYTFLSNRWVSSAIPAFLGIYLAWTGQWKVLWPSFSAANQLLAAITLFTVAAWIYKKLDKKYVGYALIPALALWVTVTAAIIWYVIVVLPGFMAKNYGQGIILYVMNIIMIILNFILIFNFFKNKNKIN